MTDPALAEELRRRRDWQAAYDAFAALTERTGATVEGLAESAWWLGRMDESIRLYAEAYRLHTDAGDRESAVLVAVQLSICTRLVGEAAQSAGWVNRARRTRCPSTSSNVRSPAPASCRPTSCTPSRASPTRSCPT